MAWLGIKPTLINPKDDTISASAGTSLDAARSDHTHSRMDSSSVAVLNSSSEVSITFSRSFPTMPALSIDYQESTDLQPVVFKVKTWTQDVSNNYTGCVIKGYRSTILPALTGIVLVGPLISALSNLNIFSGSAAGVTVMVIAISTTT